MNQKPPLDKQRSRKGTIYLAVLGTTMIVSVIALTSLSVARLELRAANRASDLREARLIAHSGVEYAITWLEDEIGFWRNDLTNDAEQPAEPLGGGGFTWKVTDADGSLTDDPTDNVTLTAYGRVGDCVAAESVTLQPAETAIDSLDFALYSNAGITLPGGAIVLLGGPTMIDSNETIGFNGPVNGSANFTNLDADVWSTNSITGSVSGVSQAFRSPPRRLPGSDAFSYYVANGTSIDINVLPDVLGNKTLEKVVLSPASNPYGATNQEGIYVIDCGGQRLNLQGLRVVGTLVILNPGAGSGCSSAIRLENAVGNYPALLVDGDFSLATGKMGVESLGEWFWNVSFNPPGTPYEGAEDNDTGDTLPATVTGLVYVTGTVNITDHSTVTGGLLAGQLAVTATMELTADYRDTYQTYPPPGFRTSDRMEIQPGSWRRGVAP